MQTALEKCIPEALFTTTDAARGTWSLSPIVCARTCTHRPACTLARTCSIWRPEADLGYLLQSHLYLVFVFVLFLETGSHYVRPGRP